MKDTPQSDCSSLFIFIICVGILLIKAVLNEGKGLECCNFIPEKIKGINIEAITAEAYADALMLIYKMSNASVLMILEILNGYYLVMR